MASIGYNIRLYRMRKGWSQSRLGDEVRLDFRKISLYETDRSTPTADVLLIIAEALDVTPNDLYGIEFTNDDMLSGCNAMEKTIIRELVTFVKSQFDKYKIR